MEMNALAKTKVSSDLAMTPEVTFDPQSSVKDEEDEVLAPSPQTSPYSDHRAALITLIGSMTPAGFEDFCSELLARVGVEDVQTVPIRLSQTPTTCGVDPCSRVKLGIGWRLGAARDAEQRAEGVERIKAPVEPEGEFIEVGL